MQHAPISKRRAISIRAMLLGTVATLSILATTGLGTRSIDAWNRVRQAETAREADLGANRFVSGLYTLLLERLATGTALQGPDPASPEVRQLIERRRAAARDDRQKGLEIIAAQDFPGRDALIRTLRTAQQRADELRRATDEALRLPKESRDAGVLRDYVPVVSAELEAGSRLWYAASHAVAAADPVLSRLAMVKEIGWRMRGIAGMEVGSISTSIMARRPVLPENVALSAVRRGQIDQLWGQFRNLVPEADATVHPALQSVVQTVQQGYFQDFRKLADEMLRAGAEAPGGRYPMDTARFIEVTTEQVGSLLEVVHAASRASEAHADSVMRAERWSLALSLMLLGVALAVAGWAVVQVIRRVARPLAGLATATGQLAGGNLDVAVPEVHRADEVGAVARALETLRDGSRRARELEAAAASERLARDRRQAAMAHHTEEFGTSVTGLMSSLTATGAAMRRAADEMAEAMRHTRDGAAVTTSGAEESARNLASVAAAVEELTASVREISRQVTEAASLAQDADGRARATDATVRGLTEAASQIGEVVNLITGIAGQTNLLALNATIEAARAGEAGKGFAVVASEVKQLAAQTARATEQIGIQIAAIQAATGEAAGAVRGVGDAIARVNEVAATIAAAVEQQGAATREIAVSVQTVSRHAETSSNAMRKVMEVVDGADATVRSVLTTAGEVAELSGTLHGQVDQFLTAVRETEEGRADGAPAGKAAA